MTGPDHKRHGCIGTGAVSIYAGLYLSFIILMVLSPLSSSAADSLIDVKGLRYHATSEYLRVVIDLSGPAEFSQGKLSGPERLFLDFKNAKLLKDLQKNYTLGDKLVKGIRLGQFTANTVRVVFDLCSAEYDFKIFNLEDPSRLIIDFFPKPDAPGAPGESKILRGGKGPEPQKPEAQRETQAAHRKIVLDAGHGGHDSGAIGPTGLCEKDVVLDIVLRMRDTMKRSYPSYEVILTRETDVFVPLPERAQVANRTGADFFLSVHANANLSRKARGIETYLLNWTNDEEALKVAARENAISVKKMKQVQSELGVILASLERDRKRDGSLALAGNIQRSLVTSLKARYPGVADLGVKQALFYVLVDAQMPSALAEVSFISNPEEERLLADGAYRQKLAEALVEGIHAYFESESKQRMAKAINYTREVR